MFKRLKTAELKKKPITVRNKKCKFHKNTQKKEEMQKSTAKQKIQEEIEQSYREVQN